VVFLENELKPIADYLFEVSWEVCNKVGGINTVIKTKAPTLKEKYKNYFFIGPYFAEKAEAELSEEKAPDYLSQAFSEMENEYGVKCYYGIWQISAKIPTILIDFQNFFSQKDNIKKLLWEKYQVDSLFANFDFDEPVVWSWAAGVLLEKISQKINDKKIVSHFHEWIGGSGLLYLKSKNSPVKTVFTTHATMLGRALAGGDFDLYGELGKFNPLDKSKEVGVVDKHTMEVACANNADTFTTVSEITGLEAEHLLGKKPDVLVLNGMDLSQTPTIEDTSVRHITCRDVIREFLSYYFFPYYQFDLKHNLSFFCASRYEFHNKGIDILIKALARLNDKLKEEGSKRTISMFFWVPMAQNGIRNELLQNKNYYENIKANVHNKSHEIEQQIISDLISKKFDKSVFENEFLKGLKNKLSSFHREGNPSVSSHYVENEYGDPIVKMLYETGLDNKEDDPVKVIVYPVYLNGNDGLLNLPYYDAMAGCHLGLFPSYYEPWGYTPVEAAAVGVSAATSNLSGFGKYVEKNLKEENPGMFIIDRINKSEEEEIQQLFNIMYDFSNLDHEERVKNKINAKEVAALCDWKSFIKFYIEAHNKAFE
jgi:glycogen(starch) synthase